VFAIFSPEGEALFSMVWKRSEGSETILRFNMESNAEADVSMRR